MKTTMNNDESIRQRNKDLHHQSALHWNSLANEQELELTRQLLSFSALFLPITASLLAFKKLIESNDVKIILVYIWIFLLLSLIAGVIQIIINIKYFVYLSSDESKRTLIWSDIGAKISELSKKENALGRTKKSSGNVCLILQITFIVLAISSILALGLFLLF